ncbi:helix-turn-helix domain-containing protein [Rhizobium sp. 2YAF20]|uniref:helix-turn-helix domain-containing protein n=1 Tax=Rhizobium sp. 2YAF20 TaxID=3233027 RepID=UPI003F9B5F01
MKTEHVEVHAGSPNIFAELGLPDAENHFLKAQIVAALHRLVTDQKLSQAKAGALMGITQPEVSRLFRGHFREYSVERLMGFLTSFNQDVEITVRPHAKAGEVGNITFNAAFA